MIMMMEMKSGLVEEVKVEGNKFVLG